MQFSFDWDGVAAYWAAHVLCQVPSCYFETVTFDHHFVAVWAVRVFRRVAWDVADVDVV